MPPKTKKVIIERYWELRSFKEIKLEKPIKVDIKKEKEEYILSVRDFPIFTYGKNLLEVQEDIEEDLWKLYSILFLKDINLGKPMIELKETFKQYLYAAEKS